MQLDQVELIDSSGLGALTRLMHIARSKGGDLKLSGLQQHIRYRVVGFKKRGQLGHLEHLYLGSRYSPGRAGDTRPRVVESSDVREFPRMLGQAAVKLPKRYRRAMGR